MNDHEWTEIALHEVADIIDPHPSHRAPDEVSEGIPFAGIGDLSENGILKEKGVRIVSVSTLDEHKKRYTITSNTLGFGRVATIGKIISFKDYHFPFSVSPTLALIEPKNIDRGILLYILQSQALKVQIDKLLTGSTRSSLGIEILRKLIVKVPLSRTKQYKIARILSTIDGQIEKTEAIIAKYQVIKQGMLQDLFTRGIDVRTGQLRPRYEDAPELYQESTLGIIPKEWKVKRLKSVAEFITSGSRGWAGYYNEEGALFIRIGNLTREHINFKLGDIKRVKLPENNEGKRTLLNTNDILISITADLGIIGVIPGEFEEAYINQHIALVRLSTQSVNSRFVGHFLAGETSQKRITTLNDSGAKAGLNLSAIGNLLFISPDIAEQNNCTELLDQQDKIIAVNKRNLYKFRLLKQGLMQDLLSGKVEVKV